MAESEAPKDTVELYRRKDKKWAWRRKDAHNGEVVATDGGQGYNFFIEANNQAIKRNPDTNIVRVEDEA